MAMLTDTACLFNVIDNLSWTSKPRFIRDLTVSREAYNNGECDEDGWIRTKESSVSVFTKTRSSAALRMIMGTEQL